MRKAKPSAGVRFWGRKMLTRNEELKEAMTVELGPPPPWKSL